MGAGLMARVIVAASSRPPVASGLDDGVDGRPYCLAYPGVVVAIAAGVVGSAEAH
jgi:hypothetical protein